MARGLVRTFQLTTLFQDMTVLQNVLMGLHLHSQKGLGHVLCSWQSFPRTDRSLPSKLLAFTGLRELADQLAKNLPHGHQRTLGIAMALAVRPRLLM